MSKHTQGEWHVGMKPGPMVYGPLGEQIADCQSIFLEDNECGHNARLIAKAPRLLELAEVMAHAEWACNCVEQHSWYGEDHASGCPQGMAQELIKDITE